MQRFAVIVQFRLSVRRLGTAYNMREHDTENAKYDAEAGLAAALPPNLFIGRFERP